MEYPNEQIPLFSGDKRHGFYIGKISLSGEDQTTLASEAALSSEDIEKLRAEEVGDIALSQTVLIDR